MVAITLSLRFTAGHHLQPPCAVIIGGAIYTFVSSANAGIIEYTNVHAPTTSRPIIEEIYSPGGVGGPPSQPRLLKWPPSGPNDHGSR